MRLPHVLVAMLIGVAACSNGQAPDTLIPQLERLAAQGDAEAQYHLGMAYWTGEGLREDVDQAFIYFQRAAESGDPLGAYKLGCLYDGQGGVIERDAVLALTNKMVAAQAGYALAQQDVAALFAEKKDFPSALYWLEKAAAQGTSDALGAFASAYNGAPGVTKDPVRTAAYFRLYLDRTDTSDKQRNWLKTFEDKLTAAQRADIQQIVATYQPRPTALTLKALSGIAAARELVARNSARP